MTPQYGKIKETTTLDPQGSTVTVEKNYIGGKVNYPIRRYYEYRIKVKDKKEEMVEYVKFSDGLSPEKLDAGIKLEHTQHGKDNGYYFVVKHYTILEYPK